MPGISTAVELTDKVTAPLNNIINTLNMTVSAFDKVNAHSNIDFNVSGVRDQLAQAGAGIAALGTEISGTKDKIEDCTGPASALTSKLAGLAGAYLSFKGLQNIVSISDELTSTTARLSNMNAAFNKINGSATTTDEIVEKIYQSAQNARGSFGDMAAIVARFGNNARDAFANQDEVIEFANLIQKQMVIAGASTQEASNAMLQLSQALGSGTLRGDELNSIFEQAPNLIQSIADYLDVPIGKIREMASEGQLSADVVKAAIFADADDINEKFGSMPMTWAQVWTQFSNSALIAFRPVLDKVNALANNASFQNFLSSAGSALAGLANIALGVISIIADIGNVIVSNWNIVGPIFAAAAIAASAYAASLAYTKAVTIATTVAKAAHAAVTGIWTTATTIATAAQTGLNAALAACPITWIIAAVLIIIAIIYAVCSAIAQMTGIASSGFGVITGGINVVIQFFRNLGLMVANIALGIGSALSALAANMMAAFHNAISSVQSWFYNLLSTALSVIAGIAEALNQLPFVEFDFSGISSAASDYAAKSAEAAANKEAYQDIGAAFNEGMSTFDAFQDGWASDAFSSGASWGDGIAAGISNSFSGAFGGVDAIDWDNIGGGSGGGLGSQALDNIDGNTGKTAANTAQSVSATEEQLKYLRDIAEQEVINRFTTAEIAVNMTNNNNVSSSMDLDGMISSLTDGVREAMAFAAEGV